MATAAKAGDVTHVDVYSVITNKIIEQLNKGTVPWRKPWASAGPPINVISKRPYHGINVLLLAMEDYEHNLFLTFDQVNSLGGKVKKGEKGHIVVYWAKLQEEKEQAEQSEENKEQKAKAILRYYYVFNISQCDKIPEKYLPAERDTKDIVSCEQVVSAMPQCPPIRHKENSAFYNFKEDFVNMPKKRTFKKDEAYYSTLFHELVHSTGHASRLNRDTITQMAEFGGEMYSQEELIAEIGTCFLQSVTGITSEFHQSTAYIQGWLTKLKGDKTFIFKASKAARKAVDFILNKSAAEEDSPGD